MRRLLLLLSLIALGGCENLVQDTFTPQIVVQGYLYANEPLDSLVLRKTLALTSSSKDDFLEGANVTISDDSTTYHLVAFDTAHKGYYHVSPVTSFIPLPGHTYHLRVEALGVVATSETTIPLTFTIDSAKLGDRMLSLTGVDSIYYPGTVQNRDSLLTDGPHLWWHPSPGCASYGLQTLAQHSDADKTWGLKGADNPDSVAMGRYRFLVLSTNEQITWEQFKRFGPNELRVLAIDRNYQDLILSVFASGSQFNNNTLHVVNGLGVFASAARVKMRVYLR